MRLHDIHFPKEVFLLMMGLAILYLMINLFAGKISITPETNTESNFFPNDSHEIKIPYQ